MDTSNGNSKTLNLTGYRNIFSEKAGTSFIQNLIVLVIVLISLYNLTYKKDDVQLWTNLLLFCLGLITNLPSKENKHKPEETNV